MMGPVQEKETMTSVRAMRKMLSSPEACRLRPLTLLPHDEGSVSSKPPRKLAAKSSNKRKKKMLKPALVERLLSALAP